MSGPLRLALALGAACLQLDPAGGTYATTDPGDFVLLDYTGQIPGVLESCVGVADAE